MRARLTYLLLSPATPAVIAHGITRLGALAAATAGLAFTISGAATHVLLSGFRCWPVPSAAVPHQPPPGRRAGGLPPVRAATSSPWTGGELLALRPLRSLQPRVRLLALDVRVVLSAPARRAAAAAAVAAHWSWPAGPGGARGRSPPESATGVPAMSDCTWPAGRSDVRPMRARGPRRLARGARLAAPSTSGRARRAARPSAPGRSAPARPGGPRARRPRPPRRGPAVSQAESRGGDPGPPGARAELGGGPHPRPHRRAGAAPGVRRVMLGGVYAAECQASGTRSTAWRVRPTDPRVRHAGPHPSPGRGPRGVSGGEHRAAHLPPGPGRGPGRARPGSWPGGRRRRRWTPGRRTPTRPRR